MRKNDVSDAWLWPKVSSRTAHTAYWSRMRSLSPPRMDAQIPATAHDGGNIKKEDADENGDSGEAEHATEL
jgi:hypothetical protein